MALTDNLVSYWKLDGNSNDSVGSNNGTDTNITYSAANGKIIQGAGFNGTSSVINYPSVPQTGAGEFTMSAWIKGSDFSVRREIIGFGKNVNGQGVSMSIGSDSTFDKLYCDFYGAFGSVLGTTSLSTSTWYFVVTTYNGTNLKIYLNGTLDGTGGNFTANIVSNSTNSIGKQFWANTSYFTGSIDEVGVWSRALSSTEITTLYNAGAGLQYPFTTSSQSFLMGLLGVGN